jgi:hypothetical protein
VTVPGAQTCDMMKTNGGDGGGAHRAKWNCEVVKTTGPEPARQLPRLVQTRGGQELVLGELRIFPAAAQGHKSGITGGDAIEEGDVHLRLMGEGNDRYCCLSVYEDYGDEGTGWRELHTGTMQGWGSARANSKKTAPVRLEATWLSMHKLVKEGLVELRASSGSEHGIASFQDVSVSVRLKAAAIERRVLDVVELEDMHTCRKYAHDLHVIMGCLQPALVDRGEQAAMPADEFEEVGFRSQKLWLHEAMKHPLTEPRAAPHPALKPKLRPYQERAAQWSVAHVPRPLSHVPRPLSHVPRPLSAPMCSKDSC